MFSMPVALAPSSHTERTNFPGSTDKIADDLAVCLELGDRRDAEALLSALQLTIREQIPSSVRLGVDFDADRTVEIPVPPSRRQHAIDLSEYRTVGGYHAHRDALGAREVSKESLFEIMLETIPIPVFYQDRRGLYVGCNKAFEALVGCAKENVIGKSADEIWPKHLAALCAEHDERLFSQGGVQHCETRIVTASGGEREVLFIKSAFPDRCGEPAGFIGAMLDITERKYTEQKLKEALDFAESVIAAIPDILFEIGLDGRYLQVWTKNPDLLAQQREALVGKTISDILPPDQAAIAMGSIREADETGTSYGSCLSIVLPDGSTRWFEHSIAKRSSGRASASTFLALSRDITERKRSEEAVNAVQAQLRGVLQTIPDIVWLKSVDGRYLLCNHAFERLSGYAEADVVGKTDFDLFEPGRAQHFRESDRATVAAGGVLLEEDWAIHKDTGERVRLETRMVPVLGPDGEATAVLGVARDITELHASRQKIHQMAFYDPLTALPNRSLFNDSLRQRISDATLHDQAAGVMLIDIDHFKAVNDTMGHPVGDKLLRQVADRLKACVGSDETVARLGGDEFALLLPSIQEKEGLSKIAGRMLERFNEPFLLDDKEIFVSCSIGIALFPDDSTDADDLMKYADTAMYLAKRSGRNAFRFYSCDLTALAEERFMLEAELRYAIERGELELYYQPKARLRDGAIFGSEALLRWRHPKRGMIPPIQFIQIAEETGLITKLGRWVLYEACETAFEMNARDLPAHKIAINFSAKEFQSQDLPKTVADCLEKTGCRAEWIEIEITESVLLDESDKALETLCKLREMGISIAIDDFGTGYSALNYLARFPIDTLKIDRSFINCTEKRSQALVKAILSIARHLGQSVVAEGVETAEQASFLSANGCEAAQGFFYSKPLPKDEIVKLSVREASLN